MSTNLTNPTNHASETSTLHGAAHGAAPSFSHGTGRVRRHRLAALAATGTLAAGLGLAATPAATAAQPAGPASTANASAISAQAPASEATTLAAKNNRGRGAKTTGFVPVTTLGTTSTAGTPVGVTSPDKRTAFVLFNKDGTAVVKRVVTNPSGRVTTRTYTLGSFDTDYYRRGTIDGTTARDVWVSTGKALYHFDGQRFRNVTLPAGSSGAYTVEDVQGRGAYVAVDTDMGSKIYRVDTRGRSYSWRALPVLPSAMMPEYGLPVGELRYVNGQLFALAHEGYSSFLGLNVYALRGTEWQSAFQAGSFHAGAGQTDFTWLAPKANRQTVIGITSDYAGNLSPYCLTWNGTPSLTKTCTTSPRTGEAALLTDGRIVTGGFKLRPASGADRETKLTGSVGSGVAAMTGSVRDNAAWAVTTSGNKVLLQRYQG